MKRMLLALAAATILSSPAFATKIGVSMDKFDDNFLTVLRNGMADYAKTLPGVTVQIEDAKDDVSKQLSQVQNFIANGVDAIIVNPVDTSATAAITRAAADAGVPLVYVNREPSDIEKLGPKAAFVGSNEVESGTLETKEICKLLGGKGNILVIEGQLSNQAAVQRTKDIHEVIATPDCSGIKIIAEQTGEWDRTKGQNLMTNWLSKGMQFDAVVSNNDEMAIGAHSGDEVGRRGHQEGGRGRRRRDAGRAGLFEGGRPQGHCVPGRCGPRQGRGRHCAQTRQGREGRQEGLHSFPASHPS